MAAAPPPRRDEYGGSPSITFGYCLSSSICNVSSRNTPVLEPTQTTVACFAYSADVLVAGARFFGPESILGPAELDRRVRMRRPVDRDDFTAARLLCRFLVILQRGGVLDAERLREIHWEQVCDACGGPHGAPRMTNGVGIGISWAHSDGLVAAAVGPGQIGVDVQRVDPRDDPPVRSVRPGSRSAAWLAFTRAEACVKAGLGSLDETLTWPLTWPPTIGRRLARFGEDSLQRWVSDFVMHPEGERSEAVGSLVSSTAAPTLYSGLGVVVAATS